MKTSKSLKKKSVTEKTIAKQKKYLVIAILCVVTMLISSSYALLTNFDQTEEIITFKTGKLNMSVNNALVTLNGNLPENDTTGLQNATPVTLTLTNTGTMFIEGYDVKLVSNQNKTSTLNEDCIKYAISEDGISYSDPKILTSDENIIFSGYDLEIDASKTIYLKVWLDIASGNQALNKEYYGSIKVDLYQKKERPLLLNEFKKELLTRTNSYILEDDTYYVSGAKDDDNLDTRDDIDFNYVWYSGKLWRITAINPDGNLKMITENSITTISWGEKATVSETDFTSAYESSWIRQWLIQEFLPTLYNYENIIDVDAGWYSIIETHDYPYISNPVKPTGEYTLIDPVGLLNTYEYFKSYERLEPEDYYGDFGGYLNSYNQSWLITPIYDANYGFLGVSKTTTTGASSADFSYSYGVRPVINLKSTVQFSSGSGTRENPYKIKDDIEDPIIDVTLLNTRQSGEYLKIEGDKTNQLFRIVDKEQIGEKLTTKVVLDGSIKEFVTVASVTTELWSEQSKEETRFWRGYLNTTWLENFNIDMLEKGRYYLGYYDEIAFDSENYIFVGNYKTTVCSVQNSDVSIKECIKNGTVVNNIVTDDYVGLLRVGEMFAAITQSYEGYYPLQLITPAEYFKMNVIADTGDLMNDAVGGTSTQANPTINLTNTVVIKSGSGTEGDPFVVGLPS